MRHLFVTLAISATILPGLSWAQSESSPRTINAEPVAGEYQIEALVTALNQKQRTMTLKGPRGNSVSLYVDESVQGFDKIKVGDKIVARYKAAVAAALRKGGSGQRALVQADASGPLQNYETGRYRSRRTTLVAVVEKVDSANGIATLKGPKGRVVDVKVEDPNILKEIQKGDQVVTVIDESIAVGLWPADAQHPQKK